jgi:deoxyadenosine/deoxycytidine kinase
MIVSVEGNIGSGKSSFLDNLKSHYQSNERIVFVDEPIEEWNTIRDKDNNTILQCFYKDQKQYAFSFQILTLTTRLIQLKKHIDKYPEHIIISERSILSDALFAELMYNEGKITPIEYQIYCKQYEYFLELIPDIHIVYLRCDPTECKKRIKKRARKGEENIGIQYLSDLHQTHEQWINKWNMNHVLIFDANIELSDTVNWFRRIEDFLDNNLSLFKD